MVRRKAKADMVSSVFKRVLQQLVLVGLVLVLSACSNRGSDVDRVPGERISVLTFERTLAADPTLTSTRVTLPRPYVNQNWPQSGGSVSHTMHHLFVPLEINEVWSADIGRGDDDYERLVSTPVVANGVVYTIDIKAEVRAFNTEDGHLIWATELDDPDENSKVGFGGGLAVNDGKIFVTTGYGFIAALDLSDGSELWRVNIGIPLRNSPTVAGGRVFAMTQDNRIVALDSNTGGFLWDYIGIVENAGVLGSASPAVIDDTVVAAFSSGEIFAMRVDNGQIFWQDALSRTGRLSSVSTLNDIDGDPVIDRGRVYAINQAGRMVSIDFRSGERVWESNVGGIYTPWVAGNYIFIITSDAQIAALSMRDGRVRWVTELQRFEDPVDRKGLIRWAGPVLAGDRLVIVSSHGYLLSVSPYTGEILSGEKISGGSVIPPIVADQTIYILTSKGKLIAYR
jgi:outer membrane protein assembly factor BamB